MEHAIVAIETIAAVLFVFFVLFCVFQWEWLGNGQSEQTLPFFIEMDDEKAVLNMLSRRCRVCSVVENTLPPTLILILSCSRAL